MKWKRMMYAFNIFSLYFICVKGMRINYNFTSINEKKKKGQLLRGMHINE